MAAALLAGAVAAVACSDSGGGDDEAGTGGTAGGAEGGAAGGAGGGALTIAFNPMYSAYDNGAHEFKVPVKVTGHTGKLTVTTSPADFVDDEPTAEGVMLVTRKAGKATVTIKDEKGNSGTAELTVTQNDPGDVDLGKERYANGNDAFNLPEGGIQSLLPEGGFPGGAFGEGGLGEGGLSGLFGEGGTRFRIPEGGLGIMRNAEAACTFCHIPDGQEGTGTTDMMRIDVEHTPQQTAGFSDEDLTKIFAEGIKPEGAPFRIIPDLPPLVMASRVYMQFHKWTVAPETRVGIIAYLRSLTPKSQPNVDFGGLLRGGAGGLIGGGGMRAMDAGAP